MKKLIDLTKTLRSKNAGPLWLTVDVCFENADTMDYVLSSGALTPEKVAPFYGVDASQVRIIPYPIVNAVKVTLPRRVPSGGLEDMDIYGCQQQLAIANLIVED